MTFEDLAPIGTEAGTLLKARGQSIAVVDGATGGLISAALLAMPGASAYFRGGGVIYTLKGRRMVLGHEPGSLRGLTSATEAYAGPGVHPLGVASGTSAAAIVGPDYEAAMIVETGHDDRLANMIAFTRNALALLVSGLSAA